MPITDARYYKTLLICPSRNIASELVPLVAKSLPLAPVQEMSSLPSRRELADLLKSFDPKIILLEFTSDPERSFALAADLASMKPDTALVAVLAGNSPDLILRCMRQGATEFLMRPFTTEQMETVVEKIARIFPAPASRRLKGSRSIAVVPAKGASGATTLATNLASHLKKQVKGHTLLADLDPLTGTVSFLLKLKTNHSFLDILARGDTVDADLWKQVVVHSHGVDVVLPPEQLMEGLDELPEATPVLGSAQSLYETVVVDCGSPFGRWNLSIVAQCDEVLLVTTNELPSLQAAQRVIEYWDQQKIDTSRLKLVINRYHREMGLNSDAISSAIDADVFHLIPSDYDTLQKAILEGKATPAGSTFGKSVAQLAEKLLAAGTQTPAVRAQSNFSVFSMFSSRT
jgi:pilus assembly protein CpaE